MAATEANSPQDALNLALARKAALEASALEREAVQDSRAVRLIRTLTPATGLVVALIAVLSALGSMVGWFYNDAKNREERFQTQVHESITNLSSTNVQQRITAIATAGGLLGQDEGSDKEIMSGLSQIFIVEDSPYVRGAIFDLFKNLGRSEVDDTALAAALNTFIDENRELTAERPLPKDKALRDAKLAVSESLIELLLQRHVQATDFKNTTLTSLNFENTNLRSADFSKAVLTDTNFDRADLDGARFLEASFDGASFIGANMRNVAMSNIDADDDLADPTDHDLDLDRDWNPPDFRCAHLEGASLARSLIAVFAKASDKAHFPGPGVRTAYFEGAHLAGASFVDVSDAVLTASMDDQVSAAPMSEANKAATANAELEYDHDVETAFLADEAQKWVGTKNVYDFSSREYRGVYHQIALSFAGSTWQSAILPNQLADLLKRFNPEKQTRALPDFKRMMCQKPVPVGLYVAL